MSVLIVWKGRNPAKESCDTLKRLTIKKQKRLAKKGWLFSWPCLWRFTSQPTSAKSLMVFSSIPRCPGKFCLHPPTLRNCMRLRDGAIAFRCQRLHSCEGWWFGMLYGVGKASRTFCNNWMEFPCAHDPSLVMQDDRLHSVGGRFRWHFLALVELPATRLWQLAWATLKVKRGWNKFMRD